MSASIYNGGLVGALDADRRPRVPDDGNWSLQGTTDQPPYRSWLLLVNDQPAFGYLPAVQRERFADALTYEGVGTRAQLLAWRGPQLQPGDTFEIIVEGGTRYIGWGDTAGEDWMEWASLAPDTLKPTVATTGRITVPGATAPPSGDRRLELDPRLPGIRDNTLTEFGQARAPFLQWAGANPNEYAKVQAYLADVADGKTVAPPALRTHKGRAIIGLLQAGAATVGRLP